MAVIKKDSWKTKTQHLIEFDTCKIVPENILKILDKDVCKSSDLRLDSFLVNTEYFSEAANFFLKHKKYCLAPQGHPDYMSFWKEEHRRCLEGYKVGNVTITGRHYFYLNYFPMMLQPKGKSGSKSGNKQLAFPKFWEISYMWWWIKELSWYKGLHLVCLKGRRAGWSYQEAADGLYNYNFIPRSKSHYLAGHEDYLFDDGIFSKVKNGINHLNENTIWFKNRQIKDADDYIISGYYDSKGIKRGYQSELRARALNIGDKTRGKSPRKITFEEAGSFKGLIDTWVITQPSVKESTIMTGQMSAFGTGGEKRASYMSSLEELFYNPEKYEVYPFENIWEEELEGTTCGFFVPIYDYASGDLPDGQEPLLDDMGRPNRERSKEYWNGVRNRASDSVKDRVAAERPFKPSEALMTMGKNKFQVQKIRSHRLRVEKDLNLQKLFKICRFEGDKLVEDKELVPFNKYPIDRGETNDGAIVFYQELYRDSADRIPDNLYFGVLDPYYQDVAENSESVGAFYVIERATLDFSKGNRIVAAYVARPENKQDFLNNVFKLAKYCNARIQFEIGGGGQSVVDYADFHKLKDQLWYSDILVNNKEIKGNIRNRSYGCPMDVIRKNNYVQYLADWLYEIRGYDDDRKPIYNLHVIYDLGLLRELERFNPTDGNFDRVSAALFIVPMLQALAPIKVQDKKSQSFENAWDKLLIRQKPKEQGGYICI